jgi:hypothetical protein
MTEAAVVRRPRKAVDLAIYPIVVGVALVVQLIAANGVGIWVSLRTLIVVVLLGFAVSASLRLLLGDVHRSGLAGFLAMVALLSGETRIVWAAAVGIGLLLVERRVMGGRMAIPWPRLAGVGRAVAAILILAIVVQAIQLGAIGVIGRSLVAEGPFRPSRTFAATTSAATPDIYVILLDGYARQDALRQIFDVDEQPFLDGLAARGLTVSSRAVGNYPNTVQVLMAMFNMRLLSDIPALQPILNQTTTQAPLAITHRLVQENPLFEFLEGKGYEIVGISSGFAEVSLREADRFITGGQLNEVEIGMLRRTVLGDVVNAVAPDLVSSQQRERITGNFAALDRLAAETPGHPRFVFAHFPSPHPPWVFHADGTPRTAADVRTIYADTPASTGLSTEELKDGYAGAVRYLQQPVLDAIDAIDRQSKTPPVIVVFGDHGSWVGADPGDVRLRFLPLLAARVPGVDRALPDDETLVNVFPDLLKPLFGASFPRVDPAPSFMYSSKGEYDLSMIGDPNQAIHAP